jgi:hypothetical protein
MENFNSFKELVSKIGLMVLVYFLFLLINGYACMLIWNKFFTRMFELNPIDYWDSVFLLIFVRILFFENFKELITDK